jgi:hypothetical protein
MDTAESFWDLAKPIIYGQLRHALTAAAGILAARGALDPSQSGAFVDIAAGFAMYASGAGWSWWQKVGQSRLTADVARFHDLVTKTVSSNKTTQ